MEQQYNLKQRNAGFMLFYQRNLRNQQRNYCKPLQDR